MKVNSNTQATVQKSEGQSQAQSAKKIEQKKVDAKSIPINEKSVSNQPGANTEISSRGKELAQAKSVAAGTPDVREEKVRALKEKLAQSKYNIDPQKIADKLVDEHAKMTSAPSRESTRTAAS